MENCHEAQEQGKTFHYAWLLLSIVIVAVDLPEDSQYPITDRDFPEAVKYASLWSTKDASRIRENKIFWVFMKMNLRMGINHKLRLSPTVYNSLQIFPEFKVEMHNIYMRVRKDPTK